jgi:NADH-quinone oxidoreductase subunit H
VIFFTSVFAETNRLPFDLPEGEAEIVAGYHVEYGGMKWSLFFMAEYLHMTTASGMVAAIFLGGWQMIPGMPFLLNLLQLQGDVLYWATVGLQVLSFVLKVVFLMIFFIVVRFTLPRFRYDQLMHLGWKILVPISLVNIVVTAFLIAYGVY